MTLNDYVDWFTVTDELIIEDYVVNEYDEVVAVQINGEWLP